MKIRQALPADAPSIARVHVESWRTTYRGIVPDEYLAGLTYEGREAVWANVLGIPGHSTFVYVAEDEAGSVVGFAAGGPTRPINPTYRGELYAIYLLEEHQGKGAGRLLAQTVIRELARRGMHSMIVWVLADNAPARRFYEALGGKQIGSKPVEMGGVTLEEVAYGWEDTSSLLKT